MSIQCIKFKYHSISTPGPGFIKLRRAHFWSQSHFYTKENIAEKEDWVQKWACPSFYGLGA